MLPDVGSGGDGLPYNNFSLSLSQPDTLDTHLRFRWREYQTRVDEIKVQILTQL